MEKIVILGVLINIRRILCVTPMTFIGQNIPFCLTVTPQAEGPFVTTPMNRGHCTIVPCATLGKVREAIRQLLLVLGALADDSCSGGASTGAPGNYRTTADDRQYPPSGLEDRTKYVDTPKWDKV